ncbi:MAG: hypothetical protein RR232_04815 [Clostridia bacterium]
MVAMILGIVAIACCIISWFDVSWLAFPGFIIGIIAWILGSKNAKANPDDKQAKAGKIMGMISTIIGIVSIVIAIIAIVAVGGMVAGAAGAVS